MAPLREEQALEFAENFSRIATNIEKVIQGKRREIELVITCLLAEGHVLIEDVPGVGKTLLAKSLARSVDCTFNRIQFTPDLLPSDVTGVSVWDRERAEFVFKPGAIFANIVVGDEINRASPKTQAALLEAMEERQGDGRRGDPAADPSVHGRGHPEPVGARRHLSPPRSPARPVHDADLDRLPVPGQGAGDVGHPWAPVRVPGPGDRSCRPRRCADSSIRPGSSRWLPP
ncbi:MAG: hypothetical protein KatS3mg011_1816 [Acidimicrobiia bacterium]|nr:MAG: hypothetical protein KatS3mg011_1816 [Acidimicrobiia bacterium]